MKTLSLYLVSFILLQVLQYIFAKPNGLTIQLIHRDSVESPLYPGNITHEERITRLLHQSRAQSSYLASSIEARNKSTHTYHPEHISPHVYFKGSFYLVYVGIGTFTEEPSYRRYFLMLDTGSTLVWTQCEGCGTNCFAQKEPLYPYYRSSTYRPLRCNRNEQCGGKQGRCVLNKCVYEARYGDGGMVSTGDLARETFTFSSDTRGSTEEVRDIIMGCGKRQIQFSFNIKDPKQNIIAGLFGIGKGSSLSFIAQLGNRAQNRFSHCLQPWSRTGQVKHSWLKFGDQANFGREQQVSTTRLYHEKLPYYHLNLLDITIAGIRLNFPRGAFTLQEDGSSGCMIDTGSPFTTMLQEHYDRITSVITPMFYGLPRLRYQDLDFCFVKPMRGLRLPSMIFHFLGANYEVRPEQLFLSFERMICLAIKVERERFMPMVIGNYMQANYKIMYDLSSTQLKFAREVCN